MGTIPKDAGQVSKKLLKHNCCISIQKSFCKRVTLTGKTYHPEIHMILAFCLKIFSSLEVDRKVAIHFKSWICNSKMLQMLRRSAIAYFQLV